MTNHGSVSTKHIPQRTCAACHKTKPKRELIRLVRTPCGNIEIDRIGRTAGRGTYLCPTWECWEEGLKGGQLQHTLRCKLTEANRKQLIRQGKELFEGVN